MELGDAERHQVDVFTLIKVEIRIKSPMISATVAELANKSGIYCSRWGLQIRKRNVYLGENIRRRATKAWDHPCVTSQMFPLP